MMNWTTWANSSGLPSRWGKGMVEARKVCTFSGREAKSGVRNRPETRNNYHIR